ncbi:hypothetical protein STVA_41820 [Allostella vacuolata]|nr:hypothetical protein STVA_41820 [Stella vacuolata]
MPLSLIPPGERKGNTWWLVRGQVNGRRVEVSTRTRDKAAAQRFAVALEARLLAQGDQPAAEPEVKTWGEAAERWLKRSVSADDRRYVNRIAEHRFARRQLRRIIQADIDLAARELYPRHTAETINRQAYTPIIAVLNYAAANHWCERRAWSRPRMREPETRAAAPNAGELLLAKAEGAQRLLILWLWQHGTRITDTLRVDWSRVDLAQRKYEIWINKTRRWKTLPIDDQVWIELANTPEGSHTGRLFPWRDRHEVYDWLGPLSRQAGVVFTPHMARHRLGKDLNDGGAGLRTIMGALGHENPKSSLRYVAEDIEIVREAQARRAQRTRPQPAPVGEEVGETAQAVDIIEAPPTLVRVGS